MNSSRQYYLEGFLAGTGRPGTVPAPAPPSPEIAPVPAPVSPRPPSWEEQTKRDLPPWDAFARLSACARADEPPSAADGFRFEWFGLFYQGPEQDAFAARVRLPGGRLQGFQFAGLARIVQELAAGWIAFNTQGGLDIPGVPVRAGAELLRRVEGLGLSTRGTGGDCVRAVRGGEWEDVPMVRELEHALAHHREFGDLPGPCEVIFRTGRDRPDATVPESIVFQATPAPAAGPGSWPLNPETDPRMWRVTAPGIGDLGIACAAAEIVPVCLALLRVWSRQADREIRAGAALASFCGRLGGADLRAAVEKEVGQRLTASPPPESVAPADPGPPDGCEVPDGRLLSAQMEALAQAATRHGIVEVGVVAQRWLLVPAAGGGPSPAFEAELRRVLSGEGSV